MGGGGQRNILVFWLKKLIFFGKGKKKKQTFDSKIKKETQVEIKHLSYQEQGGFLFCKNKKLEVAQSCVCTFGN